MTTALLKDLPVCQLSELLLSEKKGTLILTGLKTKRAIIIKMILKDGIMR